jgi:hypothetical protein
VKITRRRAVLAFVHRLGHKADMVERALRANYCHWLCIEVRVQSTVMRSKPRHNFVALGCFW